MTVLHISLSMASIQSEHITGADVEALKRPAEAGHAEVQAARAAFSYTALCNDLVRGQGE